MTQPVEMTITRALVELKRLDREINNAIQQSTLYIAIGKDRKIPNITFDEAQRRMQSNFDEMNDLVTRRSKIQDAIHVSNAKTQVVVNGKSMSVLQAINMKTTADYQNKYLTRLIALRQQAVAGKDKHDQQLETKVDSALLTLVGKDAKADQVQIDLVRKSQEDMYKAEVVDLEKVDQRIETLKKQVDSVVNELDFILSESNAITKIVV